MSAECASCMFECLQALYFYNVTYFCCLLSTLAPIPPSTVIFVTVCTIMKIIKKKKKGLNSSLFCVRCLLSAGETVSLVSISQSITVDTLHYFSSVFYTLNYRFWVYVCRVEQLRVKRSTWDGEKKQSSKMSLQSVLKLTSTSIKMLI